jgi:hypothetical protein
MPKIRPTYYEQLRKDLTACNKDACKLSAVYLKYSLQCDGPDDMNWSRKKLRTMVNNDGIQLIRYVYQQSCFALMFAVYSKRLRPF